LSVIAPGWARRLAAPVLLLASLVSSVAPHSPVRAQSPSGHTVTWDSHSLLLDGKRLLLFSGEFHYWRLPSPQLWQDRLEKMKAAGLNAVSIYFDWQYHSSAPGRYDFTGIRDVNRLLDITDRLGLYVLARVGPYMNAEADAGGLPGWLLTQPLFLRSQTWTNNVAQAQYSPLYVQYSREWYDHILPIIARHQTSSGGSVLLLQVENEYSQDQGSEQYMRDLMSFARSDGIVVPIFHNDYWFNGSWSKVVDLYAFDSYPYGFACCHQWWDLHFHGMDTWEETFRNQLKITTPMFVSELQAGSFDGWHGAGYDAVARTLDGDWLNVSDQTALAQGATGINTYMFAGGTSWGYMGSPDVYTSYDYGAPISESGALRPSYYSAHRLGSFLQSYGPTLAQADVIPGAAHSSNAKVLIRTRIDSQSGQTFIFLRHGDAGAAETTTVKLHTSAGVLNLPQKPGTGITVPGHGAELLTGNVQTGPLHLTYSTSQVLTDCTTAQGHYLVLYGPAGSDGETSFTVPDAATTVTHNEGVTVKRTAGQIRLNYQHTDDARAVSLTTADGTLHLLITSTDSASRYWCTNGMLIAGPDLVTGGDSARPTLWSATPRQAVAYGIQPGASLLIDGQVTAQPDSTMGAILLGNLQGGQSIALPVLNSWKFAGESPEVAQSFNDSAWTPADHTSTTNPNVPSTSTLLADDYGFHYGFVWYRGHFIATGQEVSFKISARQSYSVYLNGAFVGSVDTPIADPPYVYAPPHVFTLPTGTLKTGQDNVIAVLTESLGHDEGWVAGPAAQSPQGILEASFDSGTAVSWKIQGNVGGEQGGDPTQGLMNASGLFGERNGWYRPGFDDGNWQSVSLPDSWNGRLGPGAIGWYRAHFSLNLPIGVQAPIGLTIPHVSDKAIIWVNGWLIGRYWEQRGPQHQFYLPQGILNPQGDNVVAIAVWNRGHVGGLTSVPTLSPYPSLTAHSLAPATSTPDQTAGYWHTQGNRIVDDLNRPVRIAAVNWFGMADVTFVPAGLDKQPLDSILAQTKRLGFNTVRLPFSNQLVEKNPVVTRGLQANPDLQGLHSLDIMDRIVAAAGRAGLKIILDDGRNSAGLNSQWNGLWYSPSYPESAWIRDWQLLAQRYVGNSTVIGADLFNEPHTGPPGPWSVKTYLKQGSTWGPYNGIEHEATDWRLGAERGGNAVLAVNPHLLVFVEGIQQYPNPSWPDGIESYWWGGILYPARQYPVELAVPHQLVYSPHEYGPLKWQMPFFGPRMSYSSLKKVWDQHWGFLERSSFAQEAPIFIGEFGTCGSTKTCVSDSSPGSQGLWFTYFARYLKQHPEIGWAYWAINGTNSLGDPTPNYILRPNWTTLRLPLLVDTLRNVELSPPPGH
jgi:beta-galactosidase GanA